MTLLPITEAVAEVDPAAVVSWLTAVDHLGEELLFFCQIGLVDVAVPGPRTTVLAIAPAGVAFFEPVLEVEVRPASA